jgi:hypothetical protein
MWRALPSNGRCLQRHPLASGGSIRFTWKIYSDYERIIITKSQTWRWHTCAEARHLTQQTSLLEIVLYLQEHNRYLTLNAVARHTGSFRKPTTNRENVEN